MNTGERNTRTHMHYCKSLSGKFCTVLLSFFGALLLAGCSGETEDIKNLPIPADAALVLKLKKTSETLAEFKQKPFAKDFQKVEGFNNFLKTIAALDTLGKAKTGKNFLSEKNFTLSLHPANDNSADFVAYFRISDEEIKLLQSKKSEMESSRAYRLDEHEYKGIVITEIRDLKQQQSYALAKVSNVLVVSTTAHLIEDVIRQYTQGETLLSSSAPADLPASDSVKAELIVHYGNIPQLLATLTDAGSELAKTLIGHMSGTSYLEYRSKESHLTFTGFTLPGDNAAKEFLHTFKGQTPQNFRLKNILPGTAASVLYFGFSRPETFNSSLLKYWDANNIPLRAERAKLKETLPHGPEILFEEMTGEAALCNIELFSGEVSDKLLYLEVSNTKKADTLLMQMAEALAKQKDDIVFREYYQNKIIRETGLSEVPYLLFGLPFTGFGPTFYTMIDNYVVMGNSVQVLKNLIDMIERDHVWGKSERHLKFLEGVFDESNFSYFAEPVKNEKILTSQLKKPHADYLNANKSDLGIIDMVSVQFSDVENMFFTGITASRSESKPVANTTSESGSFAKSQNAFSNTVPLKGGVRYVRNSTNNKIFIQDIDNRLICLDDNLKFVWSAENVGEIKPAPIHTPDLYANGKTQFLFTTGDKVHCYDRLGSKVEGFPFATGLPSGAEGISLFDYDFKKDYRLMLYDKYGKIKLTDKSGKIPAGWEGSDAGTGLIAPPLHAKIKFQDIIIYVDANGKVYGVGRRGENKPGFPVALSSACSGPVHFTKGADLDNSYLTLITGNGELCQISLSGKVKKRQQLVKPDASTKFMLLPATYGNSFCIVRKTGAAIEFLDAAGNTVFSQGFRNEQLQIRYFDFGGSGKLFEVHDPTLLRSYLFGSSGSLLNEYPASGLSEITESKPRKFNLYRMFGNKIISESFAY